MEDLETIKQLYRDGSYVDHRSSPHLSGRLLVIVWNHGPESSLYMPLSWFAAMAMISDFTIANFCYTPRKWAKKVLGYVMICDSFIRNVIPTPGLKHINICTLSLSDEEGGLTKMLTMQ